MWWWNDAYYGPVPWMFMPLMMFLFMAFCAGMMFLMMRHMGHSTPRKSTIEMLEDGLARGEITPAQYQQLKAILQG